MSVQWASLVETEAHAENWRGRTCATVFLDMKDINAR